MQIIRSFVSIEIKLNEHFSHTSLSFVSQFACITLCLNFKIPTSRRPSTQSHAGNYISQGTQRHILGVVVGSSIMFLRQILRSASNFFLIGQYLAELREEHSGVVFEPSCGSVGRRSAEDIKLGARSISALTWHVKQCHCNLSPSMLTTASPAINLWT